MKYCEEYAALLDLYVDAELTADEMQRVEAHLAECPACRAYVDDALAIRAAFADLEDVEVPAGFAESVCAVIRAENTPRKVRKAAHWGRVLVPLAACCAIVILLQNGPVAGKGNSSDAMMKSANTSTAASTETAPAEAEYKADEPMLFSADDAGGFADQMTTVTTDTAAEETEEATVEDTEPAENGSSASRTEEQKETAVEQQEPGAEQPKDSEDSTKGKVSLATLVLPAEAAEFLADFTPVEESDTQAQYHLLPAECEHLQLRLDEAGIDYVVGCSAVASDETILIILSK